MQVEECLTSPNTLVPLLDLFQSCVRQLASLSDLVADPLSDIERRILIALVTIDVHNRYAEVFISLAQHFPLSRFSADAIATCNISCAQILPCIFCAQTLHASVCHVVQWALQKASLSGLSWSYTDLDSMCSICARLDIDPVVYVQRVQRFRLTHIAGISLRGCECKVVLPSTILNGSVSYGMSVTLCQKRSPSGRYAFTSALTSSDSALFPELCASCCLCPPVHSAMLQSPCKDASHVSHSCQHHYTFPCPTQ